MLSRAHTLIGSDGLLQDERSRGQLADVVARFAAFVAD
jgi:hypothetical protein